MKTRLSLYHRCLFNPMLHSPVKVINRELKNKSFKKGEVLKYRLHYGWFNAGEGTVSILPDLFTINNKPCYRMEIDGQSKGAFAAMYKVDDHWRSYIDTSTLIPQKFFRDIKEGGSYAINETMFYHHDEGRLNVQFQKNNKDPKTTEYDVPKNVHDIVSGFYYFRNIDYTKMKKGGEAVIDAFLEDKLYRFGVRYEGKEKVKTDIGKVNAIKLVPIMPENELFEGENSIIMWLSDDENKIPLKVKAKMFVGAVEVELTDYSGLRHQLNVTK